MKITIKLLTGKSCTVDVAEDSSTEHLKSLVSREVASPESNFKLIFKGKTLKDGTQLREYNIKEGDKVHLAFKSVPVTPDSPKSKLETELKKILKEHYSEEESNKVFGSFMKILERRLTNLSLDDIERICSTWSSEQQLRF